MTTADTKPNFVAPRGREEFFGGLESLRGIAAILVVLFHMNFGFQILEFKCFRGGYLMVDLFFVLSGFVICHKYGSAIGSGTDLARFLWLRLGRVYPLHLFFLMTFLGMEFLKRIGEIHFGLVPNHSHAFAVNNGPAFMTHLFLVQAFFPFADKTFDAPSWSISTEFYTYILFGILVIACRPARIMVTAFAVAAGSLTGLYCLTNQGLHVMNGWGGFLRCVAGFFLGVLTFGLYKSRARRLLSNNGWLGWGVVALLATYLSVKAEFECDFLVLPLFGLLVLIMAENSSPWFAGPFNWPPMRWLGKVSYSIYLSHAFVLLFLQRLDVHILHLIARIHSHPVQLTIETAVIVANLAVVGTVSHVTYTTIEVPWQAKFRKVAARFFPREPNVPCATKTELV